MAMRHSHSDRPSWTGPGRHDWGRLSLVLRRRYRRLIAYHVRRARQWMPELPEEDLLQEIEAGLWMALRTWRSQRAKDMQFSTYLHWHLSKRLGRLHGEPSSLRLASDGQAVSD